MVSGIIGFSGFGEIFNDSTIPRIRLMVFLAKVVVLMFHDVRPLMVLDKYVAEVVVFIILDVIDIIRDIMQKDDYE
uniref:Uncharacterized protein n=1 Tax=Glossina brevipalpis TaxID=37001 RepID=A0A1A9W419_9MUSC